MTSINKLLEYHELLMNYEDTSNFEQYDLPTGYHFEFYKNERISKSRWIFSKYNSKKDGKQNTIIRFS